MAEKQSGRGAKRSETKKQEAKKPSGAEDMERIRRQLRKLAFGKPNDCVRLVLGEKVDIKSLDLAMLTEIKRNEKGSVEIKLADRTKALEQLAALAESEGCTAEDFLDALIGSRRREAKHEP